MNTSHRLRVISAQRQALDIRAARVQTIAATAIIVLAILAALI